jgi:hypothetical protein
MICSQNPFPVGEQLLRHDDCPRRHRGRRPGAQMLAGRQRVGMFPAQPPLSASASRRSARVPVPPDHTQRNSVRPGKDWCGPAGSQRASGCRRLSTMALDRRAWATSGSDSVAGHTCSNPSAAARSVTASSVVDKCSIAARCARPCMLTARTPPAGSWVTRLNRCRFRTARRAASPDTWQNRSKSLPVARRHLRAKPDGSGAPDRLPSVRPNPR